MVRVSSPAKLRPWSELTAKMVMGVVPGLVIELLRCLRLGCPLKRSLCLSWAASIRHAMRALLANIISRDATPWVLFRPTFRVKY